MKRDAGWWAQNKIADIKFVEIIEYFLSKGVIETGDPYLNVDPEQKIPSWVKNVAGWWGKDKVDDILNTEASIVLGGDCGCLLNISGAIKYSGKKINHMHIAEFIWRRINISNG